MPYYIDPDYIQQGDKTTVQDLQIVVLEGNDAELRSAGNNLPVVSEGEYMYLTGSVGNSNRSVWLAGAAPTTGVITATKTGTAPVNHGPQAGGQIWHGGRMIRSRPGNFPPDLTEIPFEDVFLMNLRAPQGTPGSDGGEKE